MAAGEIYLGDVGTSFDVEIREDDTPLDISTATALKIILKPPDHDGTEYTAVWSTAGDATGDGTDGRIEYVTQSGDIDVIGRWKLQAKITLPTGTYYSEIKPFQVFPPLPVA